MLSSILLIFLFNFTFTSSSTTTKTAYYQCHSSSNFGDDTGNNQTLNLFLFAMPTNVIGQDVYYFARSTNFTSSTSLALLHCLELCQIDIMDSVNCFNCIRDSCSDIGNICPDKLEITPPSGYDGTSNNLRVGICLSNLTQSDCNACLRAEFEKQSDSNCQGAIMYSSSCSIRHESYHFQELSLPSRKQGPTTSPTPSIKGERRNGRTLVIAIVVPLIFVLVVVACLPIIVRKKRKKNGADEGAGEGVESCVEFSLRAIKDATNDFSTTNKLGRGGFGEVYLGRLRNGEKIAVKRLVSHSSRGEMEFKNEVRLVAKLHHRNLIKLIGFCIQGNERILLYEFAQNGSLDRLLFDPIQREHLNWQIRRTIIDGIARGMLYLHEESQLRIVHRDLKASNILLDESMNAKISDFGTARLFIEDKGSASKIVGTYGYMAPEYAKHGKISVKIDVFSFGVLLLEIMCGKKNGAPENPNQFEHLLSKAWKYWAAGKLMEVIDPILLKPRSGVEYHEIRRSVQIGLLCVQEDAETRPTMNVVVLLLQEGSSQSLPSPRKPAYFMAFDNDPNELFIMEQSASTPQPFESEVNSGISSVTEVSITGSLDPR